MKMLVAFLLFASSSMLQALPDEVRERESGWRQWGSGEMTWLGLSLLGMFAPLHPPAVGTSLWLLASMSLTYFGFSLASVAYQAWGAEIGRDAGERTRLTASREGFGLLGVVLPAALPATLVLFFVADVLQVEAWSGGFLVLYFVSGVAFLPLWMFLARRYGNVPSWVASMFVAVASFAWAWGLGAGDVWAFSVICLLSGAALG